MSILEYMQGNPVSTITLTFMTMFFFGAVYDNTINFIQELLKSKNK